MEELQYLQRETSKINNNIFYFCLGFKKPFIDADIPDFGSAKELSSGELRKTKKKKKKKKLQKISEDGKNLFLLGISNGSSSLSRSLALTDLQLQAFQPNSVLND